MKISIVTVSFNQARFLVRAMESVLDQHYPELEYIVVDPGSTDGSRELIAQRSEQIAVTILEPDRGAAHGLNKGFARATGEIFGFLNADDILYPGSLTRVAQYFKMHPECDVVFGSGHTIDAEDKPIQHFHAHGFSVNRHLYGGAVWLQQATFFRAEVFRRSPGFNEDNRTCWDGELLVKMVNTGAQVAYIQDDLAAFRIHNASISGSGRLSHLYLKDRARIFREIRARDWNRIDDARGLVYRLYGYMARKFCTLSNHKEEVR